MTDGVSVCFFGGQRFVAWRAGGMMVFLLVKLGFGALDWVLERAVDMVDLYEILLEISQ